MVRQVDDGDDRIRVMLLVSSLGHGGAERQVVHLANNLDSSRFDVHVCSLSPHVPLAEDLRDRESRLHVVEKRWRFDLALVLRLADLMRKLGTQLVHTYMFDAEIAGRLAARLAGAPVVIGSERNSDVERPLIHRVCMRLTRSLHTAVIANSNAGKRYHSRTFGAAPQRIHVVHNGVDWQRYRPQNRDAIRSRLEIPVDRPVIGMVAKFTPQKNHPMFLRMAKRVLDRQPDALFCLVGGVLHVDGSGSNRLRSGGRVHQVSRGYERELTEEVDRLGLRDHCLFLGKRDDLADLYNAFDVTVLTSRHEGTPNVLLESMACGVPVVATDVADNVLVVPEGRAGFIVPLDDDQAMADRVCRLIEDDALRDRMGSAARSWVGSTFTNEALARKTEDVYLSILLSKVSCGSSNDTLRSRLAVET